MTEKEIDAMEVGPELDRLIAEIIMGDPCLEDTTVPSIALACLQANPNPPEKMGWVVGNWVFDILPGGEIVYQVSDPKYSSSIGAAWRVVEKMRPLNGYLVCYAYNRTYAIFGHYASSLEWDEELTAEANGEYATPLAICKAALKAVILSHAAS